MTGGHILEASAAMVLWVAIPGLFFRRDLQRRWSTRTQRRAEAKRLADEKAAADNRLRDELAAKYLTPDSKRAPDARG